MTRADIDSAIPRELRDALVELAGKGGRDDAAELQRVGTAAWEWLATGADPVCIEAAEAYDAAVGTGDERAEECPDCGEHTDCVCWTRGAA